MSNLRAAHSIEGRVGTAFLVADTPGHLVCEMAYPDAALEPSGLLPHVRIPIAGPTVEIVGPPVQHVRDFVRRHGGVARADDRALAILKAMAGREGPPPRPFGRWPRALR